MNDKDYKHYVSLWEKERPEDLYKGMSCLANAGGWWMTRGERIMKAKVLLTIYLDKDRKLAVDYLMLTSLLELLERLLKEIRL